jgi:hypothetical protein
VTGDPVDRSPGAEVFSPDRTTPLALIVFQGDGACSSPDGNGQDYLAGLGSDTVTVDASSLVPGTTYIAISPGFVRSVADGTRNAPAVVQGAERTASFYGGGSCIPIKVSGTVPTT